MDGKSDIVVDVEVTEFRESPSAGGFGEDGLARGQRPRLHPIEQARMCRQFEPVHVQVAHGNRHPAAQLVGNLDAALLGIRSAHSPILIVPEARVDNATDYGRSRRLPGGREVTQGELRRTCRRNRRSPGTTYSRRRRNRSPDGGLNEPAPDGRHPREYDLRIWQVAGAAPFASDKQLTDTGKEAVIENTESGAHHGAGCQCIGETYARLKIVQ